MVLVLATAAEGLADVRPAAATPALSVGFNPVKVLFPSARLTDMLEHPGGEYDFNGERLRYPDIRLVYWAGGNPFHHHQDINRLLRAWRRPETIIVHDPWWTATTRHADIVLPTTTVVERNDIGASSRDRFIIAMKQAISPVGQARDDFAIFSELADRFGVREAFTEGRTEMEFGVTCMTRRGNKRRVGKCAGQSSTSFGRKGTLRFLRSLDLSTSLRDFRKIR